MRTLFAAALRLFMAIELIQSAMQLFYIFATSLLSWDAYWLDTLIPSFGSVLLYLLIYWKADWLAEKARIPADMPQVSISAKSIVAAGLILYGVYGLANLFFQSFDFIVNFFGSEPLSTGSGQPTWEAARRVGHLIIFTYIIVAAGKLAEIITRPLRSGSGTENPPRVTSAD